jgi:hypothetical protein
MNDANSSLSLFQESRAVPAIFFAGLACGVLDVTAAFVTWALQGVGPGSVLRGIASALIGPGAFRGGTPTAVLGLALHFLIAFSAAAVFYVAGRQIPFMTERPILAGVLYGVCVYVVMYWIVMPLSKLHPNHALKPSIIAIVTHMFCVGLPIALVVRRFSR